MLIVIAQVLGGEQLTELQSALSRADFSDGRLTAGWSARLVKRNSQAAPDPALDQWRDRVQSALSAHPVFRLAALPKRIIGPMFSRYQAGDHYGPHADEPLMDGTRIDLSFTLYLSPPESYDGGELTLDTHSGTEAHKYEAGSVMLYPANTLHHVAPVVRGTRYAAVGWVRSHVREAEKRELLFDLETARQRLFAREGKTAEHDLLSKTYANLVRMWCED